MTLASTCLFSPAFAQLGFAARILAPPSAAAGDTGTVLAHHLAAPRLRLTAPSRRPLLHAGLAAIWLVLAGELNPGLAIFPRSSTAGAAT